MSNPKCFYCVNHKTEDGQDTNCNLGIDNAEIEDLKNCKKYYPCNGFQIGGYYSHMTLKGEADDLGDACLEWTIYSDGEFPVPLQSNNFIEFHVCDFKQVEEWVKFWGKFLRGKGFIK